LKTNSPESMHIIHMLAENTAENCWISAPKRHPLNVRLIKTCTAKFQRIDYQLTRVIYAKQQTFCQCFTLFCVRII